MKLLYERPGGLLGARSRMKPMSFKVAPRRTTQSLLPSMRLVENQTAAVWPVVNSASSGAEVTCPRSAPIAMSNASLRISDGVAAGGHIGHNGARYGNPGQRAASSSGPELGQVFRPA